MSIRENARQHPRITFKAPLRWQVRGRPQSSNTLCENVSANGIRFSSEQFIAPKTEIMLELNLLSRVIHPIASIVRANPFARSNKFDVGARFLELDAEEQKVLSDFISMKVYQNQGVI
jgi:hypothetical protein